MDRWIKLRVKMYNAEQARQYESMGSLNLEPDFVFGTVIIPERYIAGISQQFDEEQRPVGTIVSTILGSHYSISTPMEMVREKLNINMIEL